MLEVGCLTDRGKIRENNEDSVYVNEKLGLFIVADGIGGHNAGEIASSMAVKHIRRYIEKTLSSTDDIQSLLSDAIRNANEAIYKKSEENENLSGMGTTVVVALLIANKLYIAHVGDSRAYMLEKTELKLLTEDHTVASGWVAKGMITKKEVRRHPMNHALTRALGIKDDVKVDVSIFPYTDEKVLLCSDGLTDMFKDEEINAILLNMPEPKEACSCLIELANQHGGRDNITAVVFVKRR